MSNHRDHSGRGSGNNGGRNRGRNVTEGERKLWQRMTEDVTRLFMKDRLAERDGDDNAMPASSPPKAAQGKIQKNVKQNRHAPAGMGPASKDAAQGRDVDGRTLSRLRKGQIRPEATLDLHGYNRELAYDALRRFIIASHSSGLRCVLVVTGKGRIALDGEHSALPGVLRRALPDWLGASDFAQYVLQWTQAQPKDGGGGAYYIYLRRDRGSV